MLTIDRDSLYSLEDFMANKGKDKLIKFYRTVAKTINFSLLFGASASSFATTLENSGFSEEDCDTYIELTHSTNQLDDLITSRLMKRKPVDDMETLKKSLKFLLVATIMRNTFFATYKGFLSRIKREQKYAVQNGFIWTHHGPIRHFPLIKYMDIKYDDFTKEYKIKGNDQKRFSEMFSHYLNEASNSAIQTMEARIVFNTWVNINRYFRKWKLKSRIWNSIHDSLDFYVYKPELELVLALANACASFAREPVKGIPMSMDFEVADVRDLAHREKTYWKHGEEMNGINIDEAISHYNKKYGTDFKWEGCVDATVVYGKQNVRVLKR